MPDKENVAEMKIHNMPHSLPRLFRWMSETDIKLKKQGEGWFELMGESMANLTKF